MSSPRPVHCLDDELSEYVAGRLPAERVRAWDRHLVACQGCGRAVAEERRLRAALAGGPSMPGDLRLSLLALGRDLAPAPAPTAGPEQLALLAPSAPPCHRSALRATVVAAAAAGVSAAAAWSLTVGGAGAVRPAAVTGATTPAVSPGGVIDCCQTIAPVLAVRAVTRDEASRVKTSPPPTTGEAVSRARWLSPAPMAVEKARVRPVSATWPTA